MKAGCLLKRPKCVPDADACMALAPEGTTPRWRCSLPRDHAGPHLACIHGSTSKYQHNLFAWPAGNPVRKRRQQ